MLFQLSLLHVHRNVDQHWTFAAGAMTASLLWFTLLAWAAGRLATLFRQPRAWRVLDASIAVMMMALAGNLTLQAVR